MGVLLIPLGMFVFFLLYKRWFHAHWDDGLQVSLRFDASCATEGERMHLTEVVENRAWFPLPILQVSFRVRNGLLFENTENMTISDLTGVSDVFCVGRGERLIRQLDIMCSRRGYYSINELSVQASDLFTADIHYENLPQSTSVSVLPGRLSGEHYELPVSHLFGDIVVRRSLFEDSFSFRGLRDYAPGDPQNMINWKASAHSGELQVNLRERTAGQRICLLLNVEAPAALYNEDLLEDGIRLAGTLAQEASAWDIPVRLISNGRDLLTGEPIQTDYGSSTDHVRALLQGLARIELSREPEVFAQILAAEAGREEGICYVVVSTSIREQTLTALCGFAADMRGNGALTWLSPVAPDMPLPVIPEDMTGRLIYRRLVRR